MPWPRTGSYEGSRGQSASWGHQGHCTCDGSNNGASRGQSSNAPSHGVWGCVCARASSRVPGVPAAGKGGGGSLARSGDALIKLRGHFPAQLSPARGASQECIFPKRQQKEVLQKNGARGREGKTSPVHTQAVHPLGTVPRRRKRSLHRRGATNPRRRG